LKNHFIKRKKELTYNEILEKYPNLNIIMNTTEKAYKRGQEINWRSIKCLYYRNIIFQKRIKSIFKSTVVDIDYDNKTQCKCDYCTYKKSCLEVDTLI
jgi:hypothetical protein